VHPTKLAFGKLLQAKGLLALDAEDIAEEFLLLLLG
jgi:hypothetical protein